jgi:hypothetical protein
MLEQNGRPEATIERRLNYDNDPRPIPAPDQPQMMGNAAISRANNIRDVQISQLDRGYIVVIGCQRFAIENASTLIAKLSEYILNPTATEIKWSEGKLF